MSSTENVDRIQVCFQISHQKWQLLQANWSEGNRTETDILNALIDRYLEENLADLLQNHSTTSQVRSASKIENRDDFQVANSLHEYINERVGEIVAQNFDSYLDRHLNERIEAVLHDEISRQIVEKLQEQSTDRSLPEREKSKSPKEREISPTQRRSPQHSNELKTAKELAAILGCSPSYITTLNRIGELVKRGWKDSGKRQGKRILYQPIEGHRYGKMG